MLYHYHIHLLGETDEGLHILILNRERNEDGKSFKNPQHGRKSKAYDEFPDPLTKDRRGGFDIHIYHFQNNPDQATFARELWERIRRECTPYST